MPALTTDFLIWAAERSTETTAARDGALVGRAGGRHVQRVEAGTAAVTWPAAVPVQPYEQQQEKQ